jgi:enoyl-CoA hydratase/carnithine racemase
MEYSDILVSTEGAIGTITLNSPRTVNALSRNMIREVISALKELSADGSLKVIIIKAVGKHFCSGHYLAEMVDQGMVEYKFIADQCTQMMNLIHEVPQIVIAQVHGVATAAGCQLVATCDLAVADETARFGTPGVKIGLFCTTPMIALTRAVGRKLAMEMLMTGRLISAEEALHYGLVNKVVPEADLEKAAVDLALSVAEASPLVLAIGKRAFYAQIEQDEARAYELAQVTIAMNLMAEDAQEGIKGFLEKKKPVWKGR